MSSLTPFPDELKAEVEGKGATDEYPHIEQIYRQLKQNCEDRKDYVRASDFHYGEREMHRRNPNIPPGLSFLLTTYCWLSGYGERCLRPLMCMAGVLVVTTLWYLGFGLLCLKDSGPVLDWTNLREVLLYSLQVMLLLKPDYYEPFESLGRSVYTLQSVLGPLLLGLFALAVRQKLKR